MIRIPLPRLASPDAARCARLADRSGVAMLELAFVLPILLLLVLGIVELGRVMVITQTATNACREACRHAIREGMSHNAVVDMANDYLDQAGISKNGRQVRVLNGSGNPVALSTIPKHQPVTIEVQLPFSANTWGFTHFVGGDTLVTQSTMRRE